MTADDLTGRFERWVERVVRDGRFWIVIGPSGANTVLDEPDHIATADLPALCTSAEDRGDAFALWEDGNWIVAEPDLLREELEERLA